MGFVRKVIKAVKRFFGMNSNVSSLNRQATECNKRMDGFFQTLVEERDEALEVRQDCTVAIAQANETKRSCDDVINVVDNLMDLKNKPRKKR